MEACRPRRPRGTGGVLCWFASVVSSPGVCAACGKVVCAACGTVIDSCVTDAESEAVFFLRRGLSEAGFFGASATRSAVGDSCTVGASSWEIFLLAVDRVARFFGSTSGRCPVAT